MTSPLNEIAMSYTMTQAHAAVSHTKRRMSKERRANLERYAATMRQLVSGVQIQEWFHPDAVDNCRHEVRK